MFVEGLLGELRIQRALDPGQPKIVSALTQHFERKLGIVFDQAQNPRTRNIVDARLQSPLVFFRQGLEIAPFTAAGLRKRPGTDAQARQRLPGHIFPAATRTSRNKIKNAANSQTMVSALAEMSMRKYSVHVVFEHS